MGQWWNSLGRTGVIKSATTTRLPGNQKKDLDHMFVRAPWRCPVVYQSQQERDGTLKIASLEKRIYYKMWVECRKIVPESRASLGCAVSTSSLKELQREKPGNSERECKEGSGEDQWQAVQGTASPGWSHGERKKYPISHFSSSTWLGFPICRTQEEKLEEEWSEVIWLLGKEQGR